MSSPTLPDYYTVYQGVWTNSAHGGRVFGATLTLNRRDGALLVAFIALFVTLVGTSFWRLVCYAFHYYRSTELPRDGLHHQVQATFRNSANGASGIWGLISILRAWRKESTSKQPYRQVLPPIAISLFIVCAFATASGFSSRISSAIGNEVLIRSDNCGIIMPDNRTILDLATVIGPYSQQRGKAHANYASQCYNSTNPETCNIYVRDRLDVEVIRNASCPFGDVCTRPNNSLVLDSGLVSLSDDLGVNFPPARHFSLRYKAQCSPLKVGPYQTFHNYTDESGVTTYARYHYGQNNLWRHNYTYEYRANTTELNLAPAPDYTISVMSASQYNGTFKGTSSVFYPIPELDYPNADLDLYFLSANEIGFAQEVKDDWYSAQQPSLTRSNMQLGDEKLHTYKQDTPVSVLACTSQKQWCISKDRCTQLLSNHDAAITAGDMAGDEAALALFKWLAWATVQSGPSISMAVSTLGSQALMARDKMFGSIQGPLPDNQWQIEVEDWFNVVLANMQATYVDVATGPAEESAVRLLKRPSNKEEKFLCLNQKIRSTAYTNISVFGLVIILSLGTIIILLSTFTEPLIAFILRRRRADTYAHLEWGVNETLQLQRLAHEGIGIGRWKNCSDSVPITEKGDDLGVLDLDQREHVRLKAPVAGWEKEVVARVDSVGSEESGESKCEKGEAGSEGGESPRCIRPCSDEIRRDEEA
ncbi:uncharacterized protein K452DRAFT_362977 [Aplosporella prunicola CBS 121167]|uniref:Uncharacterized protein n=1 Tax=Aplosporella prunicola CBS 121167 TaxID=1176127 RepID=A0A6A6AXS0_9PEZI|nr:uncharacterized protein K452DRAFT_362977 [Aplosporella prunicola CBS 121167]KAF2135754.1 hypothetical protein K452DRAFT_362977 [Aplosporella prunicola CBS 121167]